MLFHFLTVSEVTGINGRGRSVHNTSGNQVDFRLRLAVRMRFVVIGILMFLLKKKNLQSNYSKALFKCETSLLISLSKKSVGLKIQLRIFLLMQFLSLCIYIFCISDDFSANFELGLIILRILLCINMQKVIQ